MATLAEIKSITSKVTVHDIFATYYNIAKDTDIIPIIQNDKLNMFTWTIYNRVNEDIFLNIINDSLYECANFKVTKFYDDYALCTLEFDRLLIKFNWEYTK